MFKLLMKQIAESEFDSLKAHLLSQIDSEYNLGVLSDLPGESILSLMLQEIAEQPEALSRTIEAEREKIARLGNFLKSRDIDLIVLVARGSSDNAALFGRYLLEITTGIPVSLSAPSVHTLYDAKLKLQRALVIGVSQSGEGEDINQVLENARECGAYTIGITNEPRRRW